MRSELEIIRAHDILIAVLNGEVGEAPDAATFSALSGAADVLCWILDHEHNQNFATNLAMIEWRIESRGYRLTLERHFRVVGGGGSEKEGGPQPGAGEKVDE